MKTDRKDKGMLYGIKPIRASIILLRINVRSERLKKHKLLSDLNPIFFEFHFINKFTRFSHNNSDEKYRSEIPNYGKDAHRRPLR